MRLFIFICSILFFTVSSAAPSLKPREAVSTTERHIIRHGHKLNCLNCFCGYDAIERARHACPPDRDLVVCPPSIPVRKCYRCSCFSRIPVTPSPVMPHPHDHDHGDVHKQDGEHNHHLKNDQKLDIHPKKGEKDHMEDNRHKNDMEDNNEMPKMGPKPEGSDHDDDHEEGEDILMSTPDADVDVEKMESKSQNPKRAAVPSKHSVSPSMPCHRSTPTPSPSLKLCSTFSRRGGTGNTVFDVDLILTNGTFNVSWQMDRVPDLLEIFYEGEKIFSTIVPVKRGGTANVKYSGNSSVVTVRVSSRTNGTGWFIQIGCPTSH